MSDKPSNGWEGIGSNRIEQVIEALIFASDEPITARRMGDVYAEVTGEDRVANSDIEDAVQNLNERYEAQDRPLRIEQWAGGYRMATITEIAPFVKALVNRQRRKRLSRSLMETLAILAYRQPVTKPEVDFVRGVDSDYAVRRLLELGLADVVGRAESVGRPLLYGTTDKFLELFGLNSLDDLPNMREVESILNDPAFHKEKARLLMKAGGFLPDASGLEESAEAMDQAEGSMDEPSEPGESNLEADSATAKAPHGDAFDGPPGDSQS